MKSALLLLCLACSITASQAVKVDGIPGLDVFSSGKTFNKTHIVKGGSNSKLRAKLPSLRQDGSSASASAPSAACASGSAELSLLEPIVMSAQLDTVLGSTDSLTQDATFNLGCIELATNCVLTAQNTDTDSEVQAKVGSADPELLTISGDYSAFFGSDTPNPGYKLSLLASNLGTTTVSAVVVSNTYPVTPTLTVLDGMLVVYLPPYDSVPVPVPVTIPELVIKFVVLTFPVTPKECCTATNQLKPAGEVCRESASSCKTDAVCDAVSGDCPANPNLPNNSLCPWHPGGSSYSPSHAFASSADSSTVQSVIASDGATKKIMMKTTGYRSDKDYNNNYNSKDYKDYDSYGSYGSSHAPCQGRCKAGACRLHLVGGDQCCTVNKEGSYSTKHYVASGDASSASTPAKEGRQELYCLKEKDNESA